MKIVVLDGYTLNPGDNPWDPLTKVGEMTLHERSTPAELVARAADANVIVVNKVRITDEILEQLPRLELIAVTATGYDCVDVTAARKRNVSVCNVPEYSTDSVAQFVFSLLLNLVHNVSLHDRLIREGEWKRSGDFAFWRTPLVELAGKTMGVFGWGRIGQKVGAIAHAMGMQVLACSRSRQDAGDFAGFDWVAPDELFAQSDVLSLHSPLTDATKGIVNRSSLSRMKPSAYLINTARGGLVAEQDLADALTAGKLAGAALDVSATEPIRDDSPLLTAPRCVLTPHIAWATLASRQRLLQITANNVAAFYDGSPANLVN